MAYTMKATLRNILIFFGILVLLACVWYFRNIVVYILVSGVLSIMGRPLVDLFCMIRIKKWTFPRSLSALITLLIIWGLIVSFFIIFIPLITTQINYFSTIDSAKIVQLIALQVIGRHHLWLIKVSVSSAELVLLNANLQPSSWYREG